MKSLDLNPSFQLSGCWLSYWTALSAVSSSIRLGRGPMLRVVETRSDIHIALGPLTGSYYQSVPAPAPTPLRAGSQPGRQPPCWPRFREAGGVSMAAHMQVSSRSVGVRTVSSWKPSCKVWIISRLRPFLPRKKREWEIEIQRSEKQKAKSKRARQGQVGQIIKDMYKEAKDVKSTRRS